jgi:transcriptional regulator with XRE-family HTH domain
MSKLSTNRHNIDQGRRLIAIRNVEGLKQAEFAEKLGLSLRAYINYERGEREMPTAMFRALCDEFRIDPLWLLNGPGEIPIRHGQRVVDLELLQFVIKLIDGWCQKHQRTLTAEKKALVIGLGYDHCVSSGAFDSAYINKMLQVAA